MLQIIYIGIGGFLGAILRFLTVKYFNNIFPTFPAGTLIVNAAGSFLIGLLAFSFTDGKYLTPELRDLLIIGFIGAFTTMSGFAFESVRLFESANFFYFGLNLFLNVFLSLIAVVAGRELILYIAK
ncbi:MAG TPA: CrcB family protein [Ignavibacteria bacterium]|nr:CrcB family protein [Ignavibacteria bacterium]HQY52294.1 CrcB family protein [Ignavibacteria bacterium]HRA99878.1 CrcB family protein [Ignavibacteria bacterium]